MFYNLLICLDHESGRELAGSGVMLMSHYLLPGLKLVSFTFKFTLLSFGSKQILAIRYKIKTQINNNNMSNKP